MYKLPMMNVINMDEKYVPIKKASYTNSKTYAHPDERLHESDPHSSWPCFAPGGTQDNCLGKARKRTSWGKAHGTLHGLIFFF